MKFILFFILTLVSFSEEVYRTKTGGGWFSITKDSLLINAFDDPDIEGVTCYTTYYDRAWTLTDSHKASLACRQTGPIVFKSKAALKNKPAVFSQSKSLFFKHTKVDRVFDKKRGVIIYLIHSTAADEDTATHSLSMVSTMGNYKVLGK